MRRSKLFSLEEIENKQEKTETETEFVIYAFIPDLSKLENAISTEQHVQLETAFKNSTRCRVRKTTKDNSSNYVFTYKLRTANSEGMEAYVEHNTKVTEEFFNGFYKVADRVLNKTRYSYKSDGVKLLYTADGVLNSLTAPEVSYEVDVFTKPDGSICQWCKIDVEIDSILKYAQNNIESFKNINFKIQISQLPFSPTNPIMALTATEEQKAFIEKLWNTEFAKKL